MASLKTIKNKIRGIDKTHKVTKAMEAVSAVKMRKSQSRALSGRPFAIAALSILKRLGGSAHIASHPLMVKRTVKRAAIVLITSDRGLAGSLNSSVIKNVYDAMGKLNLTPKDYSFICLGKKGYEHFAKRGFSILHHEVNVSDEVSHDSLALVSTLVTDLYIKGEVDVAVVAFTNFISTFEQKATSRTLLPLDVAELEGMVRDILPKKGKFSDETGTDTSLEENLLYTIEPDPETVLTELFPYLLQIGVYHALLEAKASEHSARMVAMKNASDKARDLSKELTREYNKARQSLITREVSEIVGGIEAMR